MFLEHLPTCPAWSAQSCTQEVETVDIILVKRQGRFSGEAFVVLPGMVQVEFALNKHKAYMGKRYVEVQQASKEVSTSLLMLTVAHRARGSLV